MIKIDLARCCMSCDYADISVHELYADRCYEGGLVAVIECEHSKVCMDYIKEPLKALPVEQLFGKETE